MQTTPAQLAALIGATVEGDPDVLITHPAKIEEAGSGAITFLDNPAYEPYLYAASPAAVLVNRDFSPKRTLTATLLRVDNVRECVGQLLHLYQQSQRQGEASGISKHAVVDERATLAAGVTVGHFTAVHAGAEVGAGTVIHDQVYIGKNVTIGEDCRFYPGVRVLDDSVIGDRVVLHANVIVGADGFGFRPDENNVYSKVPQVGRVVIEDDVEIGAGSTIDRATMGSTLIRRGVKLDNLVMIGHNVEIGENTVIAAQTGIAGSTKVGPNCRFGGQVGISGHISIAEGTQLQAQSGIAGSIKKAGQALFGSPAIGYRDFIRAHAVFKQLPDLYKRFHKVEKKLEE